MSRRNSAGSGLEALGVSQRAGTIYEIALTHRSYASEQSEPVEHNERLEFLGDAILDAVVTELIYRRYPDLTEGEMAGLRSAVVNTNALADLARSLDLGPLIRFGRGEEASGGAEKPSLLADTFEALLGAVFIDRGMDAVADFLVPIFTDMLDQVLSLGGGQDPKNRLQETVVRERGELPTYRVASAGPEHDKRFVAHVFVGDRLLGEGSGRSKKEAEQNAARAAIEHVEHDGLQPTGGSPDARAS